MGSMYMNTAVKESFDRRRQGMHWSNSLKELDCRFPIYGPSLVGGMFAPVWAVLRNEH